MPQSENVARLFSQVNVTHFLVHSVTVWLELKVVFERHFLGAGIWRSHRRYEKTSDFAEFWVEVLSQIWYHCLFGSRQVISCKQPLVLFFPFGSKIYWPTVHCTPLYQLRIYCWRVGH